MNWQWTAGVVDTEVSGWPAAADHRWNVSQCGIEDRDRVRLSAALAAALQSGPDVRFRPVPVSRVHWSAFNPVHLPASLRYSQLSIFKFGWVRAMTSDWGDDGDRITQSCGPFNCPPGGQMNEQPIHQQLIQWPAKWRWLASNDRPFVIRWPTSVVRLVTASLTAVIWWSSCREGSSSPWQQLPPVGKRRKTRKEIDCSFCTSCIFHDARWGVFFQPACPFVIFV